MDKSAENLLLKLYREKKLAPFYIIRGPISSTYCPLLEWSQKFSALLLSEHLNIPKEQSSEMVEMGHRDLLFITKDNESENDSDSALIEDQKAYKVDDPHMREYFKAVQYGPMDLHQKFIFIDKGQLISEYFANKWLKTLEEPAAGVTTLFLVENQAPLLKTIESRAITLRVQNEDARNFYHCPETHEDFPNFLERSAKDWDLPKSAMDKIQLFCQKPTQYHHLLDALKEAAQLKTLLYRVMNDYMLAPNHSLYAQQHWLDEMRWFQKAQTFNNSASERFFGLMMCVMESTAHKVNS